MAVVVQIVSAPVVPAAGDDHMVLLVKIVDCSIASAEQAGPALVVMLAGELVAGQLMPRMLVGQETETTVFLERRTIPLYHIALLGLFQVANEFQNAALVLVIEAHRYHGQNNV